MKKIFSLALVLCFAVAASAMPQVKKAPQKGEMKDARVTFANRNMPALNAEQLSSIKTHMQDQKWSNRAMLDRATKPTKPINNLSRRVANTTSDTIEVKDGYTMYLGTLFAYYYGAGYGDIWDLGITGMNDEYVMLEFVGLASDRLVGQYRDVIGDISVTPGDTVSISGTLKIEYVESGSEGSSPLYAFSGTFYDEDNNEYILTGNYAFEEGAVIDLLYAWMCDDGYDDFCDLYMITLTDAPVTPTGDIEQIDFEVPASKLYLKNEKAWYITAQDDEYFAGFEVYTDSLGGTFGPDDINYAYTKIAVFGQDTTIVIDTYKPLSVTIDDQEDTIFFAMSMLDIEGVQYNVSMFYPRPACTDTIDIVLTGDVYYYGGDKILMCQAYSEEYDSIITIAVYADSIVGNYTEKEMYPSNSMNYVYINETQYAADKYTAKVVAGGEDYPGYYAVYMLFNGYNSEDMSDNHCFRVIMALYNAFEYDANKPLDVTLDAERSEFIDSTYYATYGLVVLEAESDDYFFYSYVIPSELDSRTILPSGTYEIAYSNDEEDIVYGSAGLDEDGYPTYGFYYDLKNEEIWFLTSGYMVMNPSYIEFEAENMNGDRIHIKINFDTTDLNEVAQKNMDKTMKVMNNGRLYILRDNEIFDARGARVK